jgi:hypothetical protein
MVCPFDGIVYPPLMQASVSPPLDPKGGSNTRLRVRGDGGDPIPTKGQGYSVYSVLYKDKVHARSRIYRRVMAPHRILLLTPSYSQPAGPDIETFLTSLLLFILPLYQTRLYSF